jgi:hypothetical protein
MAMSEVGQGDDAWLVNNRNIHYYPNTSGIDEEGNYMWLQIDADSFPADDEGGLVKNWASIRSITQQVQYWNGYDGWDSLIVETAANSVYNNNQSDATAMKTLVVSSASLSRAFVSFDLSPIASVNRVITDTAVNVTTLYHASFTNGNAIIQISDHEESGGDITTANFLPTAAVVTDSFAWNTVGYDQTHTKTLNAAGQAYVLAQAAEGTPEVKFALREYDHDYLSVEPAFNTPYQNGMHWSGSAPVSGQVKEPFLTVTYNKVPVWVDVTAEANWTATDGSFGGGVWTSDAWHTNGSHQAVDLAVNGSWADGERWCAIKITSTTGGYFNVSDGSYDIISSVYTSSEQVRTLPFRGTAGAYDITNIAWIKLNTGTPFTVSKIEVLER